MKHLDLFSGVGGFSLGLKQAGFNITRTMFSEVDKYAISVYQRQFKEAEYVGSVVDVSGVEADIITFGSPCQDFSLAGKRAGMAGERSSLISHALRLIDECKPKFFIWENVKGVFSSNAGADFWAIIKAFADIGGYRLEWQLLNTSWFLPQNRERIYLVGTLGGGSGGQIFPIGENDRGNKQGRGLASDVRALTAGGNSGGLHSNMTILKVPEPTKRGYTEAHEGDSINFSQPSSKTRRGRVGVGVAQTLDTACNQGVVQPKMIQNSGDIGNRKLSESEKAFCLRATPNSDGGQKLINRGRIRRLTPIECERLQGFPYNWTEYGKDGEAISDTQRYKMMGNAVSVPVVKAVGESILACEGA